jgi:choline dehydrogenase-like flavoprotein
VAGIMSTPIDMWLGPMQGARSREFGADEPGRNGYTIESAPGHPGLLALALPWEGTEAHARLMAGARSIAPFIAVTRDGGEGRTTLTRAGRVRVDYQLDAAGIATMRHATVRMARLARAAGAIEVMAAGTPPIWFRGGLGAHQASDTAFARFEGRLENLDFGPNRGSVFSAHQMGTARMGADPRDHACDPDGRLRSGPGADRPVRGLYVADGSLFPTALGVNPMLTIMVLARRVARTVLAEG